MEAAKVPLILGRNRQLTKSPKNVAGKNAAFPVEGDPFHLQERPFHRETAAETAKAAVAPDHPVTGDDKRKGIAGHHIPHCPGAAGDASFFRQPSVRNDTASRDCEICQ